MQASALSRVLKLRYSLFDMPFVLAGGLLAGADQGWPKPWVWLWIVAAMVLGRCAGMAFNEAIDRHIDGKNPRTAGRAIPAGQARAATVFAVAILASVLFCGVGLCINPATAIAGPMLIGMIVVYSYLKRVTPFCHLFLGLIMACGPIMASIALSGRLVPGVLWLASVFLTSITANDIIYGSQDFAFDRSHGVYSIPAWLGIRRAWQVAAWLHALSVVGLIGTGIAAGLGLGHFLLAGGIALYLMVHHLRIRRGSSLQAGFLRCNKVVAIGTFTGILGGILWRG